MNVAILLLLIAIVRVSALAQAPQPRALARVLEHHHLDLDGDGKLDDLILWFADSLDPGIMNRVGIHGSRSGTSTLVDTVNRWDAAPADFKGTHNLISSRLAYVADVAVAGPLLFLFGPDVGCCFQSLAIYQLTATGPKKYFEAPEFRFSTSPDPRPGIVATFAGAGRSEGVGAPTGFTSAFRYVPILAYRLEQAIRVDTAATIAANQNAHGGFAGFSSRDDIIVVVRNDGSHALWDVVHNRPFR